MVDFRESRQGSRTRTLICNTRQKVGRYGRTNKQYQKRKYKAGRKQWHIYSLPPFSFRGVRCVWKRLVLEAAVLVLAEQRKTDGGQGVGFEELQALFEGVVDLDLAGAVEDGDAAGSGNSVSRCSSL